MLELRFYGMLSVIVVGMVSCMPTHWGQESVVKRLQAKETQFKDSAGKTKEGVFAKYKQVSKGTINTM